MNQLLILLILPLLTQGALKIVNTPAEFQSALDSVSPGDTIQLAPAEFEGEFTITKDGPATITGDRNSTIKSVGGGTGLSIQGNKWTVKALKITEPNIGILVDGEENSIEGVVMQKVGTGMLVRGENNAIKSCVISEADGGIVVEASRNKLYYNSVNIQAPSITLEEGTCCGLLDGNVANGRLDLKGMSYNLTNNVCNHGMYVTGCDNSFSGNVANGASFPEGCQSNDLGGNVYRGLGPNDTDPPRPGQPQQQHGNQGQYNNNQGQGQYNNNNGGQQYQQPNYGNFGGSQVSGQVVPTSVKTSMTGITPQCTCTCA